MRKKEWEWYIITEIYNVCPLCGNSLTYIGDIYYKCKNCGANFMKSDLELPDKQQSMEDFF